MINCLFCEQHNCEWWGVDRWVESCPANPYYDEEEDEEERAVEKFCKDMIADWAKCLARQYIEIGNAVLNFCNAFTLVYPPNDKDCPALLAGAFEEFKEAMGIETVKCVGKEENEK